MVKMPKQPVGNGTNGAGQLYISTYIEPYHNHTQKMNSISIVVQNINTKAIHFWTPAKMEA